MTQINTLSARDYAQNAVQSSAPHSFMAPGGISDALLAALLRHSETVPPTQALPALPPARKPVEDYAALAAVPSFGSGMLQLIVQVSAQMRRRSAETRADQLQSMAHEMENQAAGLHAKAATLQSHALAAGVIGMVMGVASSAAAGVGIARVGVWKDAASQLFGTLIGGTSAAGNAAGSMSQGLGQSAATLMDEAVKRSEAEVERARSGMEYLKSLEESLRELIAKAIATQDAIQQNTNQTRNKILG